MALLRNLLPALAVVVSLLVPVASYADDHATKEEAVTMVGRGIADLKEKGPGVYAEISNPHGKYITKDLYLVVYDLNGICLAHGQTIGLVGKDLSRLRDVDGKAFVQERIELAKTKDSFWQEYKYINPVTHSMAPKESYCEKTGNVVVCGGVYK